MPVRRAVAALVAAGLVACSTPSAVPNNQQHDTATPAYAGPYAIDQVQSTCTAGNPDEWDVSVHTEGWADHVTLSFAPPAADTGAMPGTEDHPLVNTAWDPNGTWDQWSLTLLYVQATSELQPGATTRFSCADQDTLAFLAVMYQTGAPDRVADCAWWGASPATRFGSIQGNTCTCMNSSGDCTQ